MHISSFADRDFTLSQYLKLCEAVLNEGYVTCTVFQYLKNSNLQERKKIAIFRHDVDRLPSNALKMAILERDIGIYSTYYFRTNKSTFKPDVIRKIENCGHEIGYHYETLSKACGNYKKAIELFVQELEIFRQICGINTISMHGSPLSKWDNRDLWTNYDFREFEIIGETYFSIDYKNVIYFNDTGRSWDPERFNLRDKVDGISPSSRIKTTKDLIKFLKKNEKPLVIQTHPERWNDDKVHYLLSFIKDAGINAVKQLLKLSRNYNV